MIRDLQVALKHIVWAKQRMLPHFSKRHWPFLHEDIHALIKDLQEIIASLKAGDQLPP